MRSLVLCTLLCLALLIPSAAAQGPPLDAQNNTIWNQYTNSPSCCTTFGSTMNEDPRFSGSGNFGTTLLLPAGTATSFVLDYAITPEEFPHALLLDPEGTVDFTIHLGGGTSTGGAVGVIYVDVAVALTLGDTVIAEGSGETVLDHAADGYKQVTYSVAPTLTRLDPADGPLAWSITITGLANGVYVSHTDANGNGFVVLPILGTEGGGSADTHHHELASPQIEHAFSSPTSDTYQLNFTSDLVNSTAEFSWEAVNGSVNASLLGADGAVLFEGTFEGNGTLSHEILGAAVGAWNLTLEYNDFNGTFSFELAELAGGAPEAPGSPDTVDNSTTEDNATAPVNSADQESPGLALVAVIGAIAIALRRRL